MHSLALLAWAASVSRKLPLNNSVCEKSKYYCCYAGCRFSCNKLYKMAIHNQRHKNRRKRSINSQRKADQDLTDVQNMLAISAHSRLKALKP